MISLSLALIIIGLSDLFFGGLSATLDKKSWLRLVGITLILSAVASYSYWLNTYSCKGSIFLFLTIWIGSCVWMLARMSDNRKWQITAIGALSLTIVIAALVIPAIAQETSIEWLNGYLRKVPWESLTDIESSKLVVLVSILIFLGPTSNGLVRCCLLVVRETPVAEPEKTLKGGRLIGPLERFLIFGLALAGQPTAAALIISAKSIIRFPELQSKGNEAMPEPADAEQSEETTQSTPSIDELTEYFLLGSLLSWSLALAAAIPFH